MNFHSFVAWMQEGDIDLDLFIYAVLFTYA